MPTIEQARAWYLRADPVHDFDHVMRVYRMAERLALAEDADMEIVRAAALLHDSKGNVHGVDKVNAGEGGGRAAHHEASAAFAEEILSGEGWEEERVAAVQHCIRAHRYRSTEAPETIEAKVLFDADKLDVLGAIGAARTIGYAVLAGEPIYANPSASFMETGDEEPGEAHSSYHEFLFKLVRVKDRLYTETAKEIAAARHDYLAGFYDQLGAETRGER